MGRRPSLRPQRACQRRRRSLAPAVSQGAFVWCKPSVRGCRKWCRVRVRVLRWAAQVGRTRTSRDWPLRVLWMAQDRAPPDSRAAPPHAHQPRTRGRRGRLPPQCRRCSRRVGRARARAGVGAAFRGDCSSSPMHLSSIAGCQKHSFFTTPGLPPRDRIPRCDTLIYTAAIAAVRKALVYGLLALYTLRIHPASASGLRSPNCDDVPLTLLHRQDRTGCHQSGIGTLDVVTDAAALSAVCVRSWRNFLDPPRPSSVAVSSQLSLDAASGSLNQRCHLTGKLRPQIGTATTTYANDVPCCW